MKEPWRRRAGADDTTGLSRTYLEPWPRDHRTIRLRFVPLV